MHFAGVVTTVLSPGDSAAFWVEMDELALTPEQIDEPLVPARADAEPEAARQGLEDLYNFF